MGAAAVPIIGQIIVSVVVSKVASKLASSLGMSDSMAGLVGMGAGMYAGYAAGPALGSSIGPTESTAGLDLATGMDAEALAQAPTAPSAMPVGGASGPGGPVGSVGASPGISSNLMQPAVQGQMPTGLLSQATQAAPPPQVAPAQTVAAAPKVAPSGTTDNWWDKIWKSEKTMDTLVGAAGGAAQGWAAGQAIEDQNKAQFDREDEMSDRWKNYSYGGKKLTYPSQATPSMQTRGT